MTGTVERLRAIEVGLVAAGLATCLHESLAGADLIATLRQPGQREIEVIVDEDGYTELRYWASLSATPAHAVAAITGALAVITAVGGFPAPIGLAGQTRRQTGGYDGAVTERAGESGMAGPRDHVAEQERTPDPARPRESDHPGEAPAQSADLQSRLEHLPVGHPSSPFRGDGSRKPRPPDLADYELPLPDELPASPEQPGPDLPAKDSARIGPDGSWEWKGRDLTPEKSHLADEVLSKCRDAEGRDPDGNYGDHGLTPAMRRIEAQLDHGHLAEDTEKHALKEPGRFKEKFAKLTSDEPDGNPFEIISRINDGVRYTYIFDEQEYTAGVTDVCTLLTASGFELYERKNVWTDQTKQYQGVNSSWMDHQSEQLFEVQIHTPASWRAKQESHLAYEVIEALSSTKEERAEAVKLQERIFREVPVPPDVESISSYQKEGW
jgi:hypothetical protein